MAMASRTQWAPMPQQFQVLSASVSVASYMSRWRVSGGRSVGSMPVPPSWWITFSDCTRRMKSHMSA